jgi:hypothetical protein
MLIESVKMRNLLNYTVMDAAGLANNHHHHHHRPTASSRDVERGNPNRNSTDNHLPDELREPDTYSFSANPIPALVIFLLGLMMSSHTQDSMISSMVHKQWGNLLAGAAFARGLTYFLLWLRPPKSVFPSRPPTELLTAFGMMGGGVIFMSSVSFAPRWVVEDRDDVLTW